MISLESNKRINIDIKNQCDPWNNLNYKKNGTISLNFDISNLFELNNGLIFSSDIEYFYALQNISELKNLEIKSEFFNQRNIINQPVLQLINGNLIYQNKSHNLEICEIRKSFKIIKEVVILEKSAFINEFCNISRTCFASGLNNGEIIIHKKNSSNKYKNKVLKSCEKAIYSLLYLKNLDFLLSGEFNQISLWSISGEKFVKKISGDNLFVTSLLNYDDKLLISGSFSKILIRSIEDKFKCIKTIILKDEGYIYNLNLLRNSYFVCSISNFNSFKIWNINHPYDCVKTIDEECTISKLIVANNSQIITATSDKKINLWSLEA